MNSSQNITIKIIAPDTHQLLRTVRAIESLHPFCIEGKILKNDTNDGLHCFLTFPLNWFVTFENKEANTEQPSQEPLCIATANPAKLGAVY
jgi:hypothetical protein